MQTPTPFLCGLVGGVNFLAPIFASGKLLINLKSEWCSDGFASNGWNCGHSPSNIKPTGENNTVLPWTESNKMMISFFTKSICFVRVILLWGAPGLKHLLIKGEFCPCQSASRKPMHHLNDAQDFAAPPQVNLLIIVSIDIYVK